jgi:hypothetical protein
VFLASSLLKGVAQTKSDGALAKKLGSDVARRTSYSCSSNFSSCSNAPGAGGDGKLRRNSTSSMIFSQKAVKTTTHTSPGKTDICREPGVLAPSMCQLVSCGGAGADDKAAEWTLQSYQMEDEIRQLHEQNMAIAMAIVEDSQKFQTIVTANKFNFFSQSLGSGTNYNAAAIQLSNLVSHMPSTSLMQSAAVSTGGVVLPPAAIVMGNKDGIIQQSFHQHHHSNITTMPSWHPHQSVNNCVATFLPRQEYVSPFNTNPNGGSMMTATAAVNQNGQSNNFWQELHATCSPYFFNNYHYY